MNSGKRSRAPLPRRQTKIKRDCRIFFQIAVKLLMIESIISVKIIMSIKAVAFQLLKGLSALTGAPYGSQNDAKLAFNLGTETYLPKPCSGATVFGPPQTKGIRGG